MRRFSYVSSPRIVPEKYSSINQMFKDKAKKFPNKENFIQRGLDGYRRTISNADLDEKATHLAQYLIQIGICKGNNIALFGPNTLEWIISELSILLAGGISVHLNINIKDGKSIWQFLQSTYCKGVILDPGERYEFIDLVKMVLSNAPARSEPPYVILIRPMDAFPDYPSFDDVQKYVIIPTPLPDVHPDDIAAVYCTSGSTGQPKLLKHSHFSCVNSTFLPPYETESNLIVYNDRPFSWFGGFIIGFLCWNQTRVFLDTSLGLKGHATEEIWNIIKNEKCNFAQLLPYFLRDLMHISPSMKDDGWRLQYIMTGGEMIDNHFTKLLDRFCKYLLVGYGSAEAQMVSSLVVQNGDNLEKGNCGKPKQGVEIKILADDGSNTPLGKTGNIHVRSKILFKGYYQRDDLTNAIMTDDGWFSIGDMGYISTDGNLIFIGRTHDIISRGTRKIFPLGIEEVIYDLEGIEMVAVVPVPDERLYEEVCVCYVAHEFDAISPSDIEMFCKDKFVVEESLDGLGDMPKYFLQFEEFPTLSTGKVNKIKLKEEAIVRLNLQKNVH